MQPDHEITPQAGTVYSWCGMPSDRQVPSDFPLTGACVTCGRFIERRTPTEAWRHRAPDAEPVTGPAQGEWLALSGDSGLGTGVRLVVVGTEEHDITPKPGTVVREADGKPGSLLAVFDYPLRATCIVCGKPVRIQRKFICEWVHVIPDQNLAC